MPDSAAEKIFAENEAALEPLVAFVQTRGRLPTKTEQGQFHEIADRFGSVRRAFGIVQRAIPPEFWEEAAAAARNDLLVYLGAAKLGGRPKFTELSDEMQEDVRGLFGSYAKAVKLADETLGLPGVDVRITGGRKSLSGRKNPAGCHLYSCVGPG